MTASLPALQIAGLSKSFNGTTVLHPVGLEIQPGEVHMLLGQNGSGKSTLIKLLSGYHVPDGDATCLVAGQRLSFGDPAASTRLGLRFVHQDLGLIADQPIADNLLLGAKYPTRLRTISPRRLRRTAREALDRVGLSIDSRTRVVDLPPAQRTGVAIARAVQGWQGACQVLVLDEPTATLPVHEVSQLHQLLRTIVSAGVAVLYVTHDLDEVFAIGDRMTILRDGQAVLAGDVGSLKRDTVVHALVGREVEAVRKQDYNQSAAQDGAMLTVESLSSDALREVSFTVASGSVVGVYGLTGSGRESLLASIFGSKAVESGEVRLEGRPVPIDSPTASIDAGMAYVPPDRKTLGGFMELTASENIAIANLGPLRGRSRTLSRHRERQTAARWFTELDIRPANGVSQVLGTFSGGNQQKVIVGKWLQRSPKVLLLDDPTQGVNVGAKAELHRQILKSASDGRAVLVSSTDVQELVALCSRVLVMKQGRINVELNGSQITEDSVNRAIHGLAEELREVAR